MQILSILRIVGVLVMWFSLTMLLPAFVALIYGDGGGKAFVQSFILSFLVGIIIYGVCRQNKMPLRAKDGFLIVVMFWLVLGTLGAIPFLLLQDYLHLSLSSALFESFSGFTTTGATVITGLDNLPKSILFYRQLSQLLGGVGIIVLAVAIIPLLGVNGFKLYYAESSGPFKNEKILPRITEIAKYLCGIYLGLNVICAVLYWLLGMDWFDAISHSFSTVANGGFSTHDDSIGYFNHNGILLVTTIFMLISGCSYNLHISALTNLHKDGGLSLYFRDVEFRYFLVSQIIFMTLFVAGLYFIMDLEIWEAIFKGTLQLTAMSTTAGYTVFDLGELPSQLGIMLIFVSILGGCAGSTTGGLKMVRVIVLWLQTKRELLNLIHPNLVHPIRLGNNILPSRALENISTFIVAFVLVFILCFAAAVACGMSGYDALTGVLATITNVGPGLGVVHQNFTEVPDGAKYVFMFAMVCGRLEFFSLLVLLSPAFWKS